MKLSLFITHAFAIGAGVLGTLAYVTTYSIPEAIGYVSADPTYIQFPQTNEPELYDLILEERLLGSVFISHPLYFHKRQEGYDLLEKLANHGHAPTASRLSDIYLFRAIDGEPEYFKKSYDWAKKAAELGKPMPLVGKILMSDDAYHTKLVKAGVNIEDGLKLLEDIAKDYYSNSIANKLSSYYEKQGNTEKADYWYNMAVKLYNNHRPEPVCTTLLPEELR